MLVWWSQAALFCACLQHPYFLQLEEKDLLSTVILVGSHLLSKIKIHHFTFSLVLLTKVRHLLWCFDFVNRLSFFLLQLLILLLCFVFWHLYDMWQSWSCVFGVKSVSCVDMSISLSRFRKHYAIISLNICFMPLVFNLSSIFYSTDS